MRGVSFVSFTRTFGPVVAPPLSANLFQGYFTIPPGNLFQQFRVLKTAGGAGAVLQVSLRFGMEDADALLAQNGVDFNPVSTVGESALGNVRYDAAAAPPSIPGVGPAFLPPHVAVFVTNASVVEQGTYEVQAAMLVFE